MGLNTNQSVNQFYATDTKPLNGAFSSNNNAWLLDVIECILIWECHDPYMYNTIVALTSNNLLEGAFGDSLQGNIVRLLHI